MKNVPQIIKLDQYNDNRGYFFEFFNKKFIYKKLNINFSIKQINVSYSKKGVLRGLHFQYPRFQSKLIYVLSGKIFDVLVDIRSNSKTYGKIYKFEINSNSNQLLYVPKGYAHGFLSLNNDTKICYAVDVLRDKKNEKTLLWNFDNNRINWPLTKNKSKPMLSKKDKYGLNLNQLYKK